MKCFLALKSFHWNDVDNVLPVGTVGPITEANAEAVEAQKRIGHVKIVDSVPDCLFENIPKTIEIDEAKIRLRVEKRSGWEELREPWGGFGVGDIVRFRVRTDKKQPDGTFFKKKMGYSRSDVLKERAKKIAECRSAAYINGRPLRKVALDELVEEAIADLKARKARGLAAYSRLINEEVFDLEAEMVTLTAKLRETKAAIEAAKKRVKSRSIPEIKLYIEKLQSDYMALKDAGDETMAAVVYDAQREAQVELAKAEAEEAFLQARKVVEAAVRLLNQTREQVDYVGVGAYMQPQFKVPRELVDAAEVEMNAALKDGKLDEATALAAQIVKACEDAAKSETIHRAMVW